MSNDKYIEQFLEDPYYRVLPNGQIETLKDRGGHIKSEWRIKPFTADDNGYYRINYKKKCLQVHRIIYAAFNGPLNPALTINHIDGNPGNNEPSNLELISQSANNLHRFRVLKSGPVMGNCKLNKSDADEIRRLIAEENMRACDLAQKYNVTKSTISMLLNNKTWK